MHGGLLGQEEAFARGRPHVSSGKSVVWTPVRTRPSAELWVLSPGPFQVLGLTVGWRISAHFI